MFFCAFYAIMFAKGICNIFNSCKQIWLAKMDLKRTQKVAPRIGLLGTTQYPANLAFGILSCKQFSLDVKIIRVSWCVSPSIVSYTTSHTISYTIFYAILYNAISHTISYTISYTIFNPAWFCF